jgi:hypothetical protein
MFEGVILIVPHHKSHNPEGVWMLVRDNSLAHEGCRDRDMQFFGEAYQRLGSLIAHRPVSRKNHWIVR